MKKILIEIMTEELPAIPYLKEEPNIINKFSAALNDCLINFKDLNFSSTPRRFVFTFLSDEFAKDFKEEIVGAPKDVAFKDNEPTKAALSFCQKIGIELSEISFKEVKGKECLYYEKLVKGKNIKDLLENVVIKFLESLNFGKSMRWGANTFSFIRPINNLCVMIDDELLDVSAYGIKSSKTTFVHRNITMQRVEFNTQDEYFKVLKEGKIILDANERRDMILGQIKNLESLHGIKVELDKDLLNEVVAITEYPNALLGTFDSEFLEVAPEVIITSMKENQRYFAVYKNNKLSNNFVTITNSFNSDLELIKKGNEKVLRARLSDALFFWDNDIKQGLKPELLSNTLYLQELGSIFDKVKREEAIALKLASIYNYNNLDSVKDAVALSKADLRTQMVGEFPELQGIVGSYYASKMGYSYEISTAIKEQYLPSNDVMPSTTLSVIVSLASKLDTLMALFSIDKVPSGNKDPYALRRAALGVLKICINEKVAFNLEDLLNEFKYLYKDYNVEKLLNFIYERFNALYDVNSSFVKAVLQTKNTNIVSIDENIKALISLNNDPDFSSKLSTFKRLANIIKDNKELYCDETLLQEQAEIDLYQAYKHLSFNNNSLHNIQAVFSLKPVIDNFFEKVMINVSDENLKNNRLALVYTIYKHIASIANLKEVSFDD